MALELCEDVWDVILRCYAMPMREVQSDLRGFISPSPTDILITVKQPDMLVLSHSLKAILLVKRTIPCEENTEGT